MLSVIKQKAHVRIFQLDLADCRAGSAYANGFA